MIKCKGYEKTIESVYRFNQEHVFEYWKELNNKQRKELLDELSGIDFQLMDDLFTHRNEITAKRGFTPAPYIPLPESCDDDKYKKAKEAGIEFIKQGNVAALLVAGGQGSRLGFDGPKGIFPVGPVSGKSLFRIHAEKILKSSRKYGTVIPWYIMTSVENHDATTKYFSENKYFGLKKNQVTFFTQDMIPSLDKNGKLILKNGYAISMNPDGHGGTLTALASSGALADMKKKGINAISYFQVDNPLVSIIDPVFTGYHILNNSDASSKGVIKTGPGEKVGVFVVFDSGETGIVEYSDLSEEKKNAMDSRGKLMFCMGNPAIHLFKRSYIEELTSGGNISLPYHLAVKKIESFSHGENKTVEGYKFEKFVFDALSMTGKNTIMETAREHEFAPVKNASGVDSAGTAKDLMSRLYHKWLSQRGISIPASVRTIEISPLLAVESGDLPFDLKVPDKEMVYLE